MNRLIELYRLIPGAGRAVGWVMIIALALYYTYSRYGLVPTVVMALGFLLIYGAVLIYRKVVKIKQRQQGLAFGKALDDAQKGPSKEEIKSAVSDLNEKWQTAMNQLKLRNIDLYELPWYMLIGEPQSGKSTTLKNSDLDFPVGTESISGGGGTRNCDWWFTEQGVILDTAGRFTFQEQIATDSAEWTHFLDLLVRHRPSCPINGVILVIPVDALLANDRETLEQKARNISDKLTHIQRQLAIQFPIYLMITKCDQIYGFVQFFNKLSADQQREMLGWSNPEETPGFDPTIYDRSFDALVDRIDRQRLQHLQKSSFVSGLDQLFVFPEEFRALKDPLRQYLELIFKPSRFKEPLLFRGYFFTSGMQEGQPIVKACKNMIQDNSILERLEKVFHTHRAFFVRDFYSKKVFPEEGLVKRTSHHHQQDKLKRQIVWGVNIALILFGALFVGMMYWSLNKRLARPKKAIQNATATLKQTRGSFFTDRNDRQAIYRTLSDLKAGVSSLRDNGSFNFFRSRSNALTESMEDTFGYVFLDRFLFQLFERVDLQLRRFALDAPPQPRNSSQELDLLLDALAELHTWQVMVTEDRVDKFKPTIKPFLELAMDPQWNGDLLEFRGEFPLNDELENWFQDVYAHSSERVQAFLIEGMVRRTLGEAHLYVDLHDRVAAFYENQPEIQNFKEKARLLNRIQQDYQELQLEEFSWQRYDEKLAAFSRHFDETSQALLKNPNDHFLGFEEIRTRCLERLGPVYARLRVTAPGSTDPADKLKQVNREAALETAKNLLAGQGLKLDQALGFARRLADYDPRLLFDPANLFLTGGQEHLTYPPHIWNFWETILKSYMDPFRAQTDPYGALPEVGQGARYNLDRLFSIGVERMTLLKRLFQDRARDHLAELTDQRRRDDFKKALDTFYDQMADRERGFINEKLEQILRGEDMSVPNPPRQWNSYVRDLNRLTRGGQSFDDFTRGPKNLQTLLEDFYSRQIREIYFGRDAPFRQFEDYVRNIQEHLSELYRVVQDLNSLSEDTLRQNRKSYAQGSFEGANQLRNLFTFRQIPTLMSTHREEVRAWAQTALQAFREKVGGVDPCPECGRSYSNLVSSLRLAGKGFPINFYGQTETHELGLGQIEISAHIAEKDELEKVFECIDVYRSLTPQQENYLKQKGKLKVVQDALAWADGVRKLLDGSMKISYKIEHIDDLVIDHRDELINLTEVFTFCEMEGGYRSRRILLNTPTFEEIVKNEDAEDDTTIMRFHNQSRAERTESLVTIRRGLFGLMAYAFDRSKPYQRENQAVKELILSLNNSTRMVKGHFVLRTSEPLPYPPNWSELLGN